MIENLTSSRSNSQGLLTENENSLIDDQENDDDHLSLLANTQRRIN